MMEITITRKMKVSTETSANTFNFVSFRFNNSSNVSSRYIDRRYLCLNFLKKDLFSFFSDIVDDFKKQRYKEIQMHRLSYLNDLYCMSQEKYGTRIPMVKFTRHR
jgi:hypothetical protein